MKTPSTQTPFSKLLHNKWNVIRVKLGNVDTSVKQVKLNYVHKIVNNECPAYMKENFVNVKDFHKYQTRFSEHNFTIPDCPNVQKVIHFTTVQLKIGMVCLKN